MVIHCALVVALTTWVVLSVVNQLHIWNLRKYDLFNLVPVWNFFAPNPVRKDLYLCYKVVTDSGHETDWRRVRTVHGRPLLLSALWNPGKRTRKVLQNYTRWLLQADKRGNAAQSIPYLAILHFLSCLKASRTSQLIRFRIVSAQGFSCRPTPKVLFTSDWHVA